jgi:hypothetical protein
VDIDSLKALADRLQASELVTDFYLKLDLFDWGAIEPMLDESVVLAFGDTDPHADLVPRSTFMSDLIARNAGYQLGDAGTFHGDYGHVVEIDGDTATVTCKFSAAHWLSQSPEDYATLTGLYIVTLVRRNDSWKIQRLWIKPIRWQGDVRRVMDEAAKNWKAHNA